jgi:putative MATE family efflux protein
MRTVARNNDNGRAQHVSSLQHKLLRCSRSSKSLLFYTNDPSDIEDAEVSDVLGTSSSSSSTPPPTFAIDFDRVQHDEVLNRMTEHVEEQFDTNDFFGEDHFSSSSANLIGVSAEGVASIQSSFEPPSKTGSAPVEGTTSSESRQIINEVTAIALPSLGGMLLDPIMSLIDTACVGQVSTTALAAMAPCTSIFQFIFFAFFFMSAATTNLVASNPPESVYSVNDTTEAAKRVDLNERVVSNASLLALVLGTLVSVSLVKFCDPLLTLAGTSPALLEAARPYLLIRAVGIPFVFLATVLQGGSLGRGNAWRPLKIFGAAGVVNLIGDVWLTLMKGWGATGAATATVAAQIAAAVYYVITSARLEKGVEASSEKLRDVALVWRGLPSNHVVKTFMNVAVALFSRSIGLMLAYSMLTRTAALGGTLALAAHQVTLQVWWLLSFLPEPMSVAAQTLITRDMKDRKHRVPNLIKTLYGMSATLGVSAAALTFAVLRNSHVTSALVADVSVQKMIATMVPFAALSQAYCPIATISDGVCIGLSSFSQLPTIMLGSFATTAVGLSIVASQGLGVVGVWACMNVFLSSRILGHSILSKKLRKYLQLAFKKNASTRGSVMPAPVAA